MREIRFYLDISAQDYIRYYQGKARFAWALSHDGLRIQFPAERLRPFVRHDGIHGEFVLRFNEQNKFVDMQRIGDLPR